MTDNEKLDLILNEIQGMKSEMQGMKTEMQGMKDQLTGLELHIENVTDWNIRLLAENHSSLVDKVNESVRVADKTALYEIQVRILTEKVDKLSKEVACMKNSYCSHPTARSESGFF